MDKTKIMKTLRDYVLITIGMAIYSFGFLMFLLPNEIPFGGIVGIATVTNTLWGLPIGVMNVLLNAPLIAAGMKILGKRFFFKTAWAIVSSSILLDVMKPFVPAYTGDFLLACLYGGIVLGIGFGIVFRTGGTTGGTDIIAKMIQYRWSINIGFTNLIINAIIIGTNALVYNSMESALYGIIATYLAGAVIDQIIYGGDKQKTAFIITNKPKDVSSIIMKKLGNGVTAIDATGMYSGNEKYVLMTVARRHETSVLKSIIAEADPTSFVILADATEVFGQGFKAYDKSELLKTKETKKNG